MGDRRQAMQASMASCQGSSSASEKVTSRDRILRGDRSGKADIQSWPEVLLFPSLLLPAPHLSAARCKALLVAGVSRLCISVRKGCGCR